MSIYDTAFTLKFFRHEFPRIVTNYYSNFRIELHEFYLFQEFMQLKQIVFRVNSRNSWLTFFKSECPDS